MEDKNKTIQTLHEKIEKLARQQTLFQQEIQKLQNEIFELRASEESKVRPQTEQPAEKITTKAISETEGRPTKVESILNDLNKKTAAVKKEKSPVEEFIGTNLLNKVGIAVLVIGIAFGAKYSIEHQLLSPLTRIILGYLAGIALILLGVRLKKAHENFSAVLLSGGMAVMYFLTYAAYDFYHFIPQLIAFALMVVFTVFTVFAAMQYDKEVIGIIGLAGAYAVPFLLSDGSGRVAILFSYVTIINSGILFLSFKKYWKRLYYFAFMLTWLIFIAWYSVDFDEDEHFWISLIFSTIFLVTFYITFLSYKLIRKEPLNKADLVCMLLNSFIYYGFGYLTVDAIEGGERFLGVFTVFTAVLHFIISAVIYKKHDQVRDVFFLMGGMVLVFLTLAVPVQLEGSWVTLVWAFEAALLSWIGRTKAFPVYEKLSLPLIVLAFISLLHDWSNTYHDVYYYTTNTIDDSIFLNIQFFTTLLVALSFGLILWQSQQQRFAPSFKKDSFEDRALRFGLPLVILLIVYVGIFKEIETFWNQRYADSQTYFDGYYQYDATILEFKSLWLIFYSAIFAIIFSILQTRFIKNNYAVVSSLVINGLVILAFLTAGLVSLSELRYSYLSDVDGDSWFILIRYPGLVLIIPLMLFNFDYLKEKFFSDTMRQTEHVLFHIATLVLLSSELVHWLDIARVENSYKLALSILWGSYALFLIILGLFKDIKHIRVLAIGLFGITLIKLFAYDMADMSTIAKTVVMIILGVLLLTASFLYNKYKKTAGNEVR